MQERLCESRYVVLLLTHPNVNQYCYCYVTHLNHYYYPMFSPVNICYSKVS